jgi:urease accessory protein
VGADLERMRADVARARPNRPSLFTNLTLDDGADEVFAELRHAVLFDRVPTP